MNSNMFAWKNKLEKKELPLHPAELIGFEQRLRWTDIPDNSLLELIIVHRSKKNRHYWSGKFKIAELFCLSLIDTPSKDGWSHMVADSIEELHKFTARIGIPKRYHHTENKNQPHYDVRRGDEYDLAVSNGAKEVARRELLTFLKKLIIRKEDVV